MRTLSSYLEAKLFEDKIGDYLASICSNDEEIVKESFVSGRMMADFYLPNGCKAMQWLYGMRNTIIGGSPSLILLVLLTNRMIT